MGGMFLRRCRMSMFRQYYAYAAARRRHATYHCTHDKNLIPFQQIARLGSLLGRAFFRYMRRPIYYA
jgi:hypothetical protein